MRVSCCLQLVAPADGETDSDEGLILACAGRWSEAEPLLEKKWFDEGRSEAEIALKLAPSDPAARAVLQNLEIK